MKKRCSMWFLSIFRNSTSVKKNCILQRCEKKSHFAICLQFCQKYPFFTQSIGLIRKFNERTFERNQFRCQKDILWGKVIENVLKNEKKVRKSIAFQGFFSTTKYRYFLKKKTDIVRISITPGFKEMSYIFSSEVQFSRIGNLSFERSKLKRVSKKNYFRYQKIRYFSEKLDC